MFPLRDHNPSQKTPWVTYALLAANILIFLSYQPLMADPYQISRFFQTWGMVPARVSMGEGWATLVTSQFLHGGWLHLGGNMLFLWIFGDNMEDEWGHLPFLLFYLVCGAAAAGLQFAAAPLSRTPMVGASGAIAGVLGGYLLLFPRARVDVLVIIIFFIRIIALPAWVMLGLWLIFQLLGGLGGPAGGGGVAYWAHTGGFVVGLALTLPLWLMRGGPAYWHRTHGRPENPESRLVATPVPRVRRGRFRAAPDHDPDRPGGASSPWGSPARHGAGTDDERRDITRIPRVPRRRR